MSTGIGVTNQQGEQMNIYVFQTPGGERWYVEKIELTYNSSDEHFEHNDQPGKSRFPSSDNLILAPISFPFKARQSG